MLLFDYQGGGGARSTAATPGTAPPVSPELQPYIHVWDQALGRFRPRTVSDPPIGQPRPGATYRDLWLEDPWRRWFRIDGSTQIFVQETRSGVVYAGPATGTTPASNVHPDHSWAGRPLNAYDAVLFGALLAHLRATPMKMWGSRGGEIPYSEYANLIAAGTLPFNSTIYLKDPAKRLWVAWEKFVVGGKLVITEREYIDKPVNPVPYLTDPVGFFKRVICNIATSQPVATATAAAAGLDPRAATVATLVTATCGMVVPPQPTLPTSTQYPTDSITAYDAAIAKWRVAVPVGLQGPSHTEVGLEDQAPAGVTKVSLSMYKRSTGTTPPWYENWVVWAAIGGGVLVVGGGTILILRRRK